MFGPGSPGVPRQVKDARMAGWYGSLPGPDRVKLRRYLGSADSADGASLIVSVCSAAINDRNYKFAAAVFESAGCVRFDAVQRYDVNESAIVAYFNTGRYEECERLCDLGLGMLRDRDVRAHVLGGGDAFPEEVNCRNFKINVAAGIFKRYDEAMRLLDQFAEDGLISWEEAGCRKGSIRAYRLQRAFDGIMSYRM